MTVIAPENVQDQVREVLETARQSDCVDPTRFALASVDEGGRPDVRYLLLKGYDSEGFVFYTNYESTKARHLDSSKHAAMAFHWFETGVQLRARGRIARIPGSESDAYFASRGRESQLGAWASRQSHDLDSRDELVARLEEVRARFVGKDVPRPEFWGGYRLMPDRLEIWRDRPDRLHERVQYTRDGVTWTARSLFP